MGLKRVARDCVQPREDDPLRHFRLDHLREDVFVLEGIDGWVELRPANGRVVLIVLVLSVVPVGGTRDRVIMRTTTECRIG